MPIFQPSIPVKKAIPLQWRDEDTHPRTISLKDSRAISDRFIIRAERQVGSWAWCELSEGSRKAERWRWTHQQCCGCGSQAGLASPAPGARRDTGMAQGTPRSPAPTWGQLFWQGAHAAKPPTQSMLRASFQMAWCSISAGDGLLPIHSPTSSQIQNR